MIGARGGVGSLRRRLLIWLVTATAAIGALALADTRAEAVRTARVVSDRILTGSAMAIAERVTVSSDGGIDVAIPFSALDMLSSAAQDQVFYRVDGPDGLLTGYDDLPLARGRAGEDIAFADLEFRGSRIRAATLQRGLTTGQGTIRVSVTVAESTLARDTLASSILARSAARIAILIAVAGAVAWVATTLALRPLDRLGRAIAARAPNDLSPLNEKAPSEVAGLVGSVDRFMARLDTALQALRNFAGNANHQIRTPLTTARTQLALARRAAPASAQAEQALTLADEALIRAERVLAQLLMLARIESEGTRPASEVQDITRAARAITEEMIPAALAAGHDLGFDGAGPVAALVEPVLFGELLRNLIDNAIVHTPPGTEITVITRPGPVLEVEDRGPPLTPRALARIARAIDPGAPDDPARIGAHGLGLRIVRDIARAIGATLEATAGREGGLRLAVRLTAPASPGEPG